MVTWDLAGCLPRLLSRSEHCSNQDDTNRWTIRKRCRPRGHERQDNRLRGVFQRISERDKATSNANAPQTRFRTIAETMCETASFYAVRIKNVSRPWIKCEARAHPSALKRRLGCRAIRRPGEIAKCARLDQRVFHQRLVETRDAKGDPVFGKQRSSHGLDSGELLRSPSRNFKNVTGANRNSRQLTEINEALERKECFFDVDQPLSDLI